MELVEAAAAPPIAEEALRDWLKRLQQLCTDLRDGTGSQPDDTAATVLLNGLLHTAYAPGLAPRHRAAACNFVCAMMDLSRTPQQHWLAGPASEACAWPRMLEVFLDRSEVSMTKSMRQILTCLTNGLLTKAIKPQERLELRHESITIAWKVLRNHNDHVRVRPAMQLLTQYLSKEVISVDGLVNSLEVDSHPGRIKASNAPKLTIEALYRTVFTWMQHDDLALTAGQFSTELFKQFLRAGAPPIASTSQVPWLAPLLEALERVPAQLGNFRNYVLPTLFRLDPVAFFQLLEVCGLHGLVEPASAGPDTSEKLAATAAEECMTELLYAALQVGKEIGMVQISEDARAVKLDGKIVAFPSRAIKSLLHARSRVVRGAGLSLAISSPTTTTPLDKTTLQHIRSALSQLFYETDAGFRGSIYSLLQQLLDRLRSALASLSKATQKQARGLHNDELRQEQLLLIKEHENFIKWLYVTASSHLHPAATYSSHTSSLRILLMLARSGIDPSVDPIHLVKQGHIDHKWSMSLVVYSAKTVRSFEDLMLDPYDDVRQDAALMVSMCPSTFEPDYGIVDRLQVLVQRAQALAQRTGRADQADGVGRAYASLSSRLPVAAAVEKAHSEGHSTQYEVFEHLISQLGASLTIARSDFAKAVQSSPLHSDLVALRYIVEKGSFGERITRSGDLSADLWRAQFYTLCKLMEEVWLVVRPVLCDDAPEGYVLDDADEMSNFTTKDTLSYCWRALKESSSLIQALIMQPFLIADSESPLLTAAHFKALGDLSFTQLSELRHRGAFSTVAQTFAACCQKSRKATDAASKVLIEQWYASTISAIEAKGSFLTRRSAGLPSLLTGILSADLDEVRFQGTIKELVAISQKPVPHPYERDVPLPQVHAMNCLRMIYINSKLGNASERHVLEGLQLATSRLGSPIWAIRNSGLMLFRALIDRMLGTYESGNTEDAAARSRFSYSNYPTLLDTVEDLLRLDPDTARLEVPAAGPRISPSLEKVFPALHLLQRAVPPPGSRQRFVPLVLKLTSCPQWHVRDIAARALVRLTTGETMMDRLSSFPPVIELLKHQNALHGYLLFLHHLANFHFAEPGACSEDSVYIKDVLLRSRPDLEVRNQCWVTRSAYTELLQAVTAEKSLAQAENVSKQSLNIGIIDPGPDTLFDRGLAPTSTDQLLVQRGFQAALKAQCGTQWTDLHEELRRLATAIRCSLHVDNIFTLRLAAVQASAHLVQILACFPADRESVDVTLSLVLSTYDALNDDDEEIRDEAAGIAHSVLLNHNFSVGSHVPCPPRAAQQLLQLLNTRFGNHPKLIEAALDRLLSSGPGQEKCLPSFQDTISFGLEADTTLFVQEKQNMYMDDVVEAQRWSQLLKRIGPAAVTQVTAKQLTARVVDGLQSAANTALTHNDGVLGWASKPAVFTALIRLLCAAEVLLAWRAKSRKVPVSGAEMRRMLYDLLRAGEAAELHPMLLQKMETILRDASLRRLQSLGKIVNNMTTG